MGYRKLLIRTPTIVPADIELRTIETDFLCAVISADNPLSSKPHLSIHDLAGEPFIGQTASGRVVGLNALIAGIFQKAGIRPPVVQEALQVHTIISLVEGGLGFALLPSVCSLHATKKAVFRKLEDMPSDSSTGIALACRRNIAVSPALRFRELAINITGTR